MAPTLDIISTILNHMVYYFNTDYLLRKAEMMAIHQEIEINAEVSKVFKALTNAKEFTKATGAPADFDASPGGAFSAFGGKISGRFIDAEKNAYVVQAWRPEPWPAGVYSLVRFSLSADGDKTRVVLDQSGHPGEMESHLDDGWRQMYWGPLKKHLE